MGERMGKESCKKPGVYLLLEESPLAGIGSILEPVGTYLESQGR